MEKKFFFFIIFFTLSIMGLMFFYILESKVSYTQISKKMLFQEALTQYKSMLITRQWNSNHNSVYVKQHDGLQVNPYLKQNHLITKNNELLIRINPAWMTRQISELLNKNSDYMYKITSLQPINPNNAPDNFERIALNYFEKNKDTKYFTKFSDNKFNFMGALKVKPSCLSCHAEQGYKVGDIRGGLRISIPLDAYNVNISQIKHRTNNLYLVSVLATLIFLTVLIYTFKAIYNKQRTIKILNNKLEHKIKQRTKELEDKTKELLKSNKKLLKISTSDFLTKLPNRRYFFEFASKSFASISRNANKLSLIVIDIDYFKKINDTYGHQVGDLALIHISNIIKNSIRESDACARIGGEEFAILLNNTNIYNAFIFAEKLRKNIKTNSFISNNSEIKITISLGIQEYKKEYKSIHEILNHADKALYQAKNTGRDKTVLFKD